ncbi:MAG: NAD-dependent epimerase/dehydratase family protein [Thermodesulfobacteriota bacterium]
MTRTAFITGATGYTGSHLARRLAAHGWRVRGLARSRQGADRLKKAGCEPVFGDITDPDSFAGGVQGADVVFHLAAEYRTELLEHEFYRVHVQGTKNVVDACLAADVERLVHCSTVGVHGRVTSPPADENAPFAPEDAYQRSKLEGERLVRQYMANRSLRAVIFRPAGIYGPGEMRFLKLFRLAAAPVTVIPGSGNTLYHFTYIDDLVEGILLCGERPEALGNTFILAGDGHVSINEAVCAIAGVLGKKARVIHLPLSLVTGAVVANEALAAAFGIRPVLYRRRIDFFTKDRAFSIDRARRVLGFDPKIGLKEGATLTARWYMAEGLL